jgi:hypothetical protein
MFFVHRSSEKKRFTQGVGPIVFKIMVLARLEGGKLYNQYRDDR